MSFVWGAVAIGGSAILNYMGSQNAASAQRDAANQASGTQMAQYNQTRQDQLPWMNRGNAAGNQLAYLLGLPGYGPSQMTSVGSGTLMPDGTIQAEGREPIQRGPGMLSIEDWIRDPQSAVNNYAQDAWSGLGTNGLNANMAINPDMGGYGSLTRRFGLGDFQVDPGYQFRMSEGQKALERSAAAKGMSLSGAQLKALTGYNQNFASNEYSNAYNRYNNDQTNLFNRLSAVAGTGQQANQFIGQLGANTANQVGQNQLAAGNAAAAGWIGGTNAINNGINQWTNWNMWNQMNANNGQPSSWSYSGMGG